MTSYEAELPPRSRARQTQLVSVVWALMLGVVSAVPSAAQYPTRPPSPTELRAMRLPPFGEGTLSNGLQIVVVENHRLPLVSISLTMPAGTSYDPPGKKGLASLTSDLLLRGTTTRSADDIAEEIEYVGSTLNTSVGADFFSLSTTVLKEHVDLAFGLMGDVLLHTTFPQEEVELTRTRILSGLRAQEAQPDFLADKYFNAALYGDHPYGRSATSASLGSMTREDVVAYAAERLRPGGSILVIAGDLSLSEARDLADRHLGDWTGAATDTRVGDVPPASPTEIVLVHRPGSAQSNILVGNLTMRPGDPEYYAAVVANKILGGGTDARLFLILREQNGWTYGAYSDHNRPQGFGRFQVNTEVRSAVTDSAVVEILHQLRRLRTERVPDDEIQGARGFLVGSFPLSIQTPQQIAGQVRSARLLGLGDDYLRTYRERLAAIDADDVMQVSQRIMRPDSAVIVVVGDGPRIHDGLAAIAPVRIIDADGEPLTVAELTPQTEQLALDGSQLAARRDSFTVLVQGNPLGTLTRSLETRTEASGQVWAVRSQMQLGALGGQSVEYVLDAATLHPVSYEQSASQMGQSIATELTYAEGGRVAGTVTGAVEATIDTAFGWPVYDADMLQTLVQALPLADGADFSIPTFRPTEQTLTTTTLRVAEGGTVTVPAGEFETWQVNLSGQIPWVFWVSKTEPRRVVKMEVVGQPLSFELAATETR